MASLVICVLIGLIPAAIAHSKGHSFLFWWFGGAALFIVALPWTIMMQPNTRELERRQLAGSHSKKCPHCAEIIKGEAVVCRFCGRNLNVRSASPLPS